ncbi:MAG: filamentous hemagglutinin N-terminal domain-containing protein, partial [Rhizobacter sp.]|nr:filamentous hemagglutinin N-terminal domain-containing protein [Rhizobacter sp.]
MRARANPNRICKCTHVAFAPPHPGLHRLKPVALAIVALAWTSLAAQPAVTQLPVAASGGAAINATVGAIGGTAANPLMTVTQQNSATNRAVIEWSSFSIGRDARVNMAQPNAQSVLLNRVMSDEMSQIFGGLSANGRVFILNPFGVLFGGTAQVNVGGLVASSLDLTAPMSANNYQQFIDGNAVELSGSGQFGVRVDPAVNRAVNKISTPQGGSVMLLGGGVVAHSGVIEAPGGQVTLAAAPTVKIVPVGSSGFIDLAIGQAATSGGVAVQGLVDVSSSAAGTRGGQINVQGATVAMLAGEVGVATLTADGPAGGGSITVGDGNTRAVLMQSGSTITADATNAGNGGTIIARANHFGPPDPILLAQRSDLLGPLAGTPRSSFGVADVYGTLTARGGPNGGDGGRIETSGAALSTSLFVPELESTHAATVDARARASGGANGVWLLDPFDVVISNAAPVASNGLFNPTGPGARVRATDISAALNNGTSVEIVTGSAGVGTDGGDITLAGQAVINRTLGTSPTSLTLRSHGNVTLAAGSAITSSNGAGPLNVNLYSDLDGNGSGNVAMLGSSIVTSGGHVAISGGVDPATGFASAGGQSPGVLLQRSNIDSSRAGAASGNVTVRGSSASATASAAGQSGVVIDASTVDAGNISINGRSGPATAVLISNSGLRTTAGQIDVRGVATRNIAGAGRSVGVDLAGAFVDVGSGSLVIAGRADENGLATSAAGAGVQLRGLDVSTATQSTGRVTIAGQSLGSTGPGIADGVREGRILDVVNNNDGLISPAGADVVIGASAA